MNLKMMILERLRAEEAELAKKPYSDENELELRRLNVRIAKMTLDLVSAGQFTLVQDKNLINALKENIRLSEEDLTEAENITETYNIIEALKKVINSKKILLKAMKNNDSLGTAEAGLVMANEEEAFSKLIIARKNVLENEIKNAGGCQ